MVINCHSKRKLREQAVIDAEAAVAAQINRTLEKQAREDPPPEYELPPTYVEAMEFDLHKPPVTPVKLSEETELDLSLTKVVTANKSSASTATESPSKVSESESESSPSSKKPESKEESGIKPGSTKRTDDVAVSADTDADVNVECHL